MTTYIGKEELEQKRTPSELSEWLHNEVEQVCSTKEGLEAFRLQKGLLKQLVEEVATLAIFGKKKFGDSDKVFLQPVIGNQQYDALVIDERDEPASVTYLELTQAHEGEDDYWRRRELLERGIVSPYAPVVKKGKGRNKMVSIPAEATSVEERANAELDRIVAAAKRKEGKSYPANTSLIILFDDTPPFQRILDDAGLDSYVDNNVRTLNLKVSTLYLVGEVGQVFREYSLNRQC